jgi:peptide/nickel transport system ATP-binding protein
MNALLEIDDLHVAIDATPILRGVSLLLEQGRVRGLVGESGAGKTMVSRVVLGILPGNATITGGAVRFDGGDITLLDEHARRHLLGREIALVPQNPMTALNPVARIGAQIDDVLRMHLNLSAAAARSRSLELLEAVHMREPAKVLRQYPHELSGGMRQRVLIAIAFACRPRLIIADEPTTALDVTVQRQILRLLKELQQTSGTAILFITHDLGVVAKICDEVSVIHAGCILEAGTATDVFARPQHPYTSALLAATPRYDRPAELLRPVPPELTAALWRDARAYDAEHIAVAQNSSLSLHGRAQGRG